MPRFTVCLHQYVEKIATLDVEADTPEKALDMAMCEVRDAELDWNDGDDTLSAEAYAVLDADGRVAWEV